MNPRQRYEYLVEQLGHWVLAVEGLPDDVRRQFFDLPGTRARLDALRAAEAECGYSRAG